MGRFAVAGVAALCGALGACPYLAPLGGTHGSLVLVSLSQLPLFIGGLWGGVTVAALAGLTASLMLLVGRRSSDSAGPPGVASAHRS
jgi:hypothetical protein